MKTMSDEPPTDSLIVTARLRSGLFESTIEVPLGCTKAQQDAFIEAWLSLMAAGIMCGQAQKQNDDTEAIR